MMRTSYPFAAVFVALLTVTTFAGAQDPKPAAPAKPAPDVLVFTNGDQLTGSLERATGGNVVFKSDMAGEITVPFDKVKELRSNGSFALLRKDVPVTRTAAHPGTIEVSGGNITVENRTATPEVVPVKDVSYLIDQATYDRELSRKAGAFTGWNGTIVGGATLVRSTTDANTYNAGIALIRAIPTVPYLPARNRTTFNLQETYGKQTQYVPPPTVVVKTNIFHADAERDEYFSPRLYALGQVSFDHNYAQGLNLQAVYGIGIGWTALKDAKQELDIKADVHYESQSFFSLDPTVASPDTLNLIGSTFSENYTRTFPHKIVFTESANILPAYNQFSAYSANGTAALGMALFKRFGLQISTTDNYLNDPPVDFKRNSYQFMTGITYTLH